MSDTKEPKLTAVEGFKEASRGLRGPIADELSVPGDHFSEEAVQLLKHHGSYQQDNRDVRTERKKAGLDREYKMMLRTKFAGGRITAEQYLLCDDLADKYGQSDLRITSRQDFQYHGVVRGALRPLINDLNKLANVTSLGGCGDVVRNTMACPVADIDPKFAGCVQDLIGISKAINDHFLPASTSYFDLWLDDEKVTVNDDGTVTYPDELPPVKEEPIYGNTYLPRKFKIGLAADFDNSVDVYTQDVGIIAATEDGKVVGYEVVVGGGLGFTHRKAHTYARLATPLCFVETADDLIAATEAVVKVQRDYGGRTDRRQARLKYLIDQVGEEKFREMVTEYAGRAFPEPRNITVSEQPDYLGWHKQTEAGLNYVGVWVENGRIKDFEGSFQFRTGLRKIVEQFKPSVRLTPHHNLVLAGIKDEDVEAVKALLNEYNIPTNEGISALRRMEMACPALPLCGLAFSEAERYMPTFIEGLEAAGHGDADVMIRMSGCPNNCSRPRTAELGLIGMGANMYQVYVGGDFLGKRLNEVYAEKIKPDALVPLVAGILSAWKDNRDEGERFGDWSHRVGVDGLRAILEPAEA